MVNSMKKFTNLIIVLIISTLLYGCDSDPRVGEVWVYENINPFEHKVYMFKVLDVKDGYVKFCPLGREEKTMVATVHWFKLSSRVDTTK